MYCVSGCIFALVKQSLSKFISQLREVDVTEPISDSVRVELGLEESHFVCLVDYM